MNEIHPSGRDKSPAGMKSSFRSDEIAARIERKTSSPPRKYEGIPMGKRTKKAAKAAKKKKKTIIAIVDGTLVFLVIILPLLAVILYAFGVPIPRLAMGIY
ncbi:MAG: hypothetical protein J1F61_07010, partial [Clostridiales bacterium]|nr:hypothetical protein [Clostridiales bacterium]